MGWSPGFSKQDSSGGRHEGQNIRPRTEKADCEIEDSVEQDITSKLTLVLLLGLFNCGWVFRQDRVGVLRDAGGLGFSAIYAGAGSAPSSLPFRP